MEKKAARFMHKIDIAPEALDGISLLSVWSDSYASVENHYGIVELKSERIRLRLKEGFVCFHGKNLCVEELERQKIKIKGKILSIEYLT